jgi:hypothetical protein
MHTSVPRVKYEVTGIGGKEMKVNYFETVELFYLLNVLFIAHESRRCMFGSKAPLDPLARSLRPRNQTALARRRHDWILSKKT